LASKNGYSLGTGLKDIQDILRAFEVQNSCEIVLSAQRMDWKGKVDLVWTATAWDGDPQETGVRLLASVRLGCGETWLVRMEDLVLRLLYALDFQLAEQEFVRKATNS
jgi:hypothetical protein